MGVGDEHAFVSDRAAVNTVAQGENLLARDVPLVEVLILLELVVSVELGRYVHLGR